MSGRPGAAEGRDASTWHVPGRIEVLGKHTDYAGGRSLLAATGQGITASGRRTSGDEVVVTSRGEQVRLPASGAAAGPVPDGHWTRYPAAVVERLAQNFGGVVGASIEVHDDLPDAAGLSSSSALVVSLALVLADLSGLTGRDVWRRELADAPSLAAYLACIENGRSFGSLAGSTGVGTFGGSEDHTAMLCSAPHQLSMVQFAPTRLQQRVAMPRDHAFVVAVSGVRAEKTGAARDLYNRVSLAVTEIVARATPVLGGAASLGALLAPEGVPDAERLATVRRLVADDDYLVGRLDQFVTETWTTIPQAVAALDSGELAGFGSLVDRSQEGAEWGLRNQVPQTVRLQRLARDLGAVAASSFGAGFGGSVWAMVPLADAEAFAEEWLGRYRAEFPGLEPRTLVTTASRPAQRLS